MGLTQDAKCSELSEQRSLWVCVEWEVVGEGEFWVISGPQCPHMENGMVTVTSSRQGGPRMARGKCPAQGGCPLPSGGFRLRPELCWPRTEQTSHLRGREAELRLQTSSGFCKNNK